MSLAGHPITVEEAIQKKMSLIPPEVIDCFNTLIVEKLDVDRKAEITRGEILERVTSKLASVGKHTQKSVIIEQRWLDVELYFQEAGWNVEYSGDYGEEDEDDCYFTFEAQEEGG